MFATQKNYTHVIMIIKTHKNTLTAYGSIWSGDGTYFVSHFSRLESEYNDITVRLHTNGGSVFDGNLMYNAINKSKANVTIIVDGISASMGAIIMLSAKNVQIVENGFVMIHAPSSYVSGNARDFEADAKLLRMIEKNFIAKLQAKTGKSKQEAEKLMDGSDHWFDAEECLAMGLVSQIIPAQTAPIIPVSDPYGMDGQDVYNVYASLLTNDFPIKNEINKTEINMKELLISALGLVGLTSQSSDTAIIEAVQKQLQGMEAAKEQAENELKEYKQAQIKATLDVAVKDGVIKAEQRSVYEDIGEKSGVDALVTVLSGAKGKDVAPNIAGHIKGGSADARANWTFDEWQKEDKKGLEKLAETDPAKFNQLFNEKYKK